MNFDSKTFFLCRRIEENLIVQKIHRRKSFRWPRILFFSSTFYSIEIIYKKKKKKRQQENLSNYSLIFTDS